MNEVELTKVFGVTSSGNLVIMEPKSVVKVVREDNWTSVDRDLGDPHIYNTDTISVRGNLEQFHLILGGSQLFEKTLESVVDQEIKKMNNMKAIIKGENAE